MIGAKPISRLARSFSVCPDNARAAERWDVDRFFLGTCSYPDRQHWKSWSGGHMRPKGLSNRQSAEREAKLAARLGVQVTRMDAGSEANFQMYAQRGVRPHLQVTHGNGDVLPKYANVTDPKWRYPRLKPRASSIATSLSICSMPPPEWAWDMVSKCTATFFIGDFCVNARGMDYDLTIRSDEEGAVVSFVRVIRIAEARQHNALRRRTQGLPMTASG